MTKPGNSGPGRLDESAEPWVSNFWDALKNFVDGDCASAGVISGRSRDRNREYWKRIASGDFFNFIEDVDQRDCPVKPDLFCWLRSIARRVIVADAIEDNVETVRFVHEQRRKKASKKRRLEVMEAIGLSGRAGRPTEQLNVSSRDSDWWVVYSEWIKDCFGPDARRWGNFDRPDSLRQWHRVVNGEFFVRMPYADRTDGVIVAPDPAIFFWLKVIATSVIAADACDPKSRPAELLKAVGLSGTVDKRKPLRMWIARTEFFSEADDPGELLRFVKDSAALVELNRLAKGGDARAKRELLTQKKRFALAHIKRPPLSHDSDGDWAKIIYDERKKLHQKD